MQKKLLTVAIGAALASPAFVAQADVTVYGAAQVEWAQIKNDSIYVPWPYGTGLQTGNFNNTNSVDPQTTRSGLLDNKRGRFGIKADEDLGGGWKGVANFEWQVDTADGADGTPISERISIVGISQKSIGTLYFGQDHSPYKLSGVPLDPFIATALEARNNYGMSGNRDGWGVMNGHNGFVQDGMFFKSATWAGVYVNAYLGLDRTGSDSQCRGPWSGNGNCDAPGGANNNKTNGDLSVAVGWKGDAGPVGLSVFGAYSKMANTVSTGAGSTADEPTAMKIGTQITLAKAHTISLQYEITDRATNTYVANDYDEANYWFVGYQGKFGPVTAVAQLGRMETGSSGPFSYEGNYMAVGAIYNMSKTFRLFGGWRQSQLEGVSPFWTNPWREDSVLSLGMRKDF